MKHLARRINVLERNGTGIGDWLSGTGAFYALLTVAALGALVLSALVIRLLPLYAHELVNLCRRSWAVLMAHLPLTGAVIPLLGLAFLLGRGGSSLIRQLWAVQRFLRTLPPRERELPAPLHHLAAELELTTRVDLVRDTQAYSFCYGFLRPRICISTGLLALLDEVELRALLLHERHHLHRRDPLRVLIVKVVGDALNVLPLVPVLVQHYRVAQEVAADRAAIAHCGSEAPLSSALLKLLTQGRTPSYLALAVGAFSVTEERIARLVYGARVSNRPWTSAWVTTLLIVMGTLLMGFAGLTGVQVLSTSPVECAAAMTSMY